jgi:hypothetical protein
MQPVGDDVFRWHITPWAWSKPICGTNFTSEGAPGFKPITELNDPSISAKVCPSCLIEYRAEPSSTSLDQPP